MKADLPMQHQASRNPVRTPLPVLAAGLMLLTCAPSAAKAEGAPFFSTWLPTVSLNERSAPLSMDAVDLFFYAGGMARNASPTQEGWRWMALATDPPASALGRLDKTAAAGRSIFGFSLAGLWPTGVAAGLGLSPGVATKTSGSFDQRVEGNVARLRVLEGERISASVWQGGFGNLLGPLRFWGDGHSVSVRQDGTGNLAFVGALVGVEQSVALRQLGTNIADISLAGLGEDNEVIVDQVGEGRVSLHQQGQRNSIHVRQDYLFGLGGDNMLSVELGGTGNVLRIEQDGDNEITVKITGNDSNANLRPGDTLRGLNLLPGQLLQSGEGSRVVIKVLGSGNQFGSRQAESGQSIRISQTGDKNQAGIVQAGEGSSAAVVQSGNGNTVSVSQ